MICENPHEYEARRCVEGQKVTRKRYSGVKNLYQIKIKFDFSKSKFIIGYCLGITGLL